MLFNKLGRLKVMIKIIKISLKDCLLSLRIIVESNLTYNIWAVLSQPALSLSSVIHGGRHD
jgi:predicted transcriptional regulator